ncbi:MAG: hypothetical protein NZM37_12315 [Sandaracinaceae bacterium]|nr:hypothetical protein [Sandaracinaceae bacterium]
MKLESGVGLGRVGEGRGGSGEAAEFSEPALVLVVWSIGEGEVMPEAEEAPHDGNKTTREPSARSRRNIDKVKD